MTSATNFWTDQRCARLRDLWEANMAAPDIAADLGCTKNAIVGKARRLGLPLVDASEGAHRAADTLARRRNALELPTLHRERKPRVRVHQKPIFGRVVEPVEGVDIPPPSIEDAARDRASLKTLVELGDSECHWPIDQPDGGFMFCASPALEGHPYCGPRHHDHCRRAYNPGAYKNALRPYVPQRGRG